MRTPRLLMVCAAIMLPAAPAVTQRPHSNDVALVRVPGGGVQPETAIDANGNVHLVYLAGEARSANVFYARSSDGGRTFARPVRVNSQEGSAIATGTVRGAQIAVSADGRVHVVWNGSDTARPQPPVNQKTGKAGMPLLYSRSNAAATAFEPQRNLITKSSNLDGGASVAAAGSLVYVGWHAHPLSGEGTEDARRVWLALSRDAGATFSTERAIAGEGTGVCGCCGLKLFVASNGDLHALYRSATNGTGRDVYSLRSTDRGRTFDSRKLHEWAIGACPMTTMAMAGREATQAWETDGQVYFASPGGSAHAPAPTATGDAARRKHPRLAVNAEGSTLLVWTVGTAWARGGSLAWQIFDRDGKPTSIRGERPGIPVWSFAAAIARPDGGFTILY